MTGDLRGSLAKVRGEGYAAVTLPAAFVRGLSASGTREVRAVIARAGLGVAAVRWDVPGKTLTPPGDVDRALDGWLRAMEAARSVGAAAVLSDLGPLPPAGSQPAPRPAADAGGLLLPSASDIAAFGGTAKQPIERDADHEAVVDDALREAAALADRTGVPLAVGSSLAGAAALSRALATNDGVMLDLDPAALLPDDAAAVLHDHAPRLLHVRGRDAQRADGRSRPAEVGEGNVDWPATLDALRSAGFDGFVTTRHAGRLRGLT